MREFSLAIVLLGCAAAAWSADVVSARGQDAYRASIQPLLEKYCYECHADGVDKGDFALDEHQDYSALRTDLVMWDHVRQQIVTHVMPPVKEKVQPTLRERDELVAWIDDAVFWVDPQRADPGHVTYRRLNRVEYNNTIRDALLIDLRPADEFPPDDSGYGFDNIGDVLSLSPMLMEKYLRAARRVAAGAMKVRAPEHAHVLVDSGRFWNQKGETSEWEGVRWFNNTAEIAANVKVPADGTYRLMFQVAATQAGDEPARMRAALGGQELGVFDVTRAFRGRKGGWQSIKHEVRLKRGETKLTVAFLNDFYDPQNPDPNRRDRNLALDEVQVDGPFGLTAPQPSRFLQWLLDGRPVGAPALELSGEDFEKGEGESRLDTGAIELATQGYVRHTLELDQAGSYRFKVKAGALQAGQEHAKFDVRIAGRTLAAFAVTARDQAPQWFECVADLPAGRHELQLWFLNDYYDEKARADRNLWVHEVTVSRGSGNEAVGRDQMPGVIGKLGSRLFRRPVTDIERDKWVRFANEAIATGESPLGALGFVLEGMLVSPSFLFRGGAQPVGETQDGSALIDEYSLASRLSYFLWCAPPDDRLLQLAARGELRSNLASEIRRMIGDWRGRSMAEHFAGQWLQLRDMDVVSPSTRRFPEFKSGTASAMKKETQLFFDHILRENRSVIEFLNGDYTFLNGPLARYYGIPGPKGGERDKFEKVSLKGTPRAGVLTQGSILTLTSNPTRTSPVKRGKFLLENILGTPPPPAPGDAPPLDDRRVDMERLTLRQQFEAHRADPGCAGCHAFLDPMGFAFENFDAVGRWREQDKGHRVDASGQLVRGQRFANLQELREILVRDMSGDFVRSLAENLLTFALGRGLGFQDRPAVNEIVKRTRAAEHRFQDMIIAVCESVPFQRMRVGS